MKNVGSMGRDTHPSHDPLFWGGGLIHFTGLEFLGFPGMSNIFFWGIPFLKNVCSRGWVAKQHIIF